MHLCHPCGKSFSRKDSLLRHQRQFCNVIMSRRRSPNRIDGTKKAGKSNNLIEYSSLDVIELLRFMLNEQRYRWRKDFKELKDALLPAAGNSDHEKPILFLSMETTIPLTLKNIIPIRTKHKVHLIDVLS